MSVAKCIKSSLLIQVLSLSSELDSHLQGGVYSVPKIFRRCVLLLLAMLCLRFYDYCRLLLSLIFVIVPPSTPHPPPSPPPSLVSRCLCFFPSLFLYVCLSLCVTCSLSVSVCLLFLAGCFSLPLILYVCLSSV